MCGLQRTRNGVSLVTRSWPDIAPELRTELKVGSDA
ncbi:hypothetical protein SCACP_18290 [Sporomusa carbonis]